MNRKRTLFAVLFGLLTFGLVAVSAATLGSFTSNKLGAADTVVAACNAGAGSVTASYTVAYSATTGKYTVASATVAGLGVPCNTQTLNVTLRDSGNVALASGSVAVSAGGGTVVFGSPPAAEAVTGIAVVVTG